MNSTTLKTYAYAIRRFLGLFGYLGLKGFLKTVYFNFKYLPSHQAIHLPVLMSGKVSFGYMKKDAIELVGGGKTRGVLRIGLQDRQYCYDKPSFFNIYGKLILQGDGIHSFAPGAQVYVGRDAILSIDEGFTASHDLKIYCKKKITIGKNNMWSYYNIVMDNDGHHIYDAQMNHINTNKEIIFGDDVWLGGRCTVQKGSVIPRGSVVGSDSLVRKALKIECAIYAGDGPQLIKENIVWDRNLV